jgi:16S rRNA (cytidine1402-2'-O)-methyltransferase
MDAGADVRACGAPAVAAMVVFMSSTPQDYVASDPEKVAHAIDSGLYIVATPIGNLADLSQRAIALLRAADIVAVEDSRVTGKLLNHIGLKKRMRPYHDHSSERDREDLLAAAQNGVVVLVSDAGTPLISDPGYKLVRAAREAGIPVSTAPGPSAAIAALSISGLPTDRFLFAGFLPSKAKARAEILAELGDVKSTLVFYESGPRLGASLAAMAEVLGNRDAAVARELTKRFEEVVCGGLDELAALYADVEPKGEIVVVIGPPTEQPVETGDVDAALREALATLPVSKAAGQIAKRFGLDRSEVYARATAIKRG